MSLFEKHENQDKRRLARGMKMNTQKKLGRLNIGDSLVFLKETA
jgi:hypothetical protein